MKSSNCGSGIIPPANNYSGKNIIKCPVCAGNKAVLYKSYEISIFQTDAPFHLAKCLACGIVFTNPHPGPDLLKTIYNNDGYYAYLPFYLSPESNRTGLVRKVTGWAKSTVLDHYYGYGKQNDNFKPNKMLWMAGRLLKKFVREDAVAMRRVTDFKKGGSHLDIGCGSGYYVWWMEKHGWQSRGIDVNLSAVEAARQAGLNVVQRSLEETKFPDASFDLVTAWEVIEHLPGLIDQLKTIRRILKPGGRLIGSVPNAESWEAGVFGKNWQPWEIPSHLYHFSPKSLKKILGLAGFELTRIEFTPILHSWDASCNLLKKKSPAAAFALGPLGRPFYLAAAAAGRGARLRFEAAGNGK